MISGGKTMKKKNVIALALSALLCLSLLTA